MLKAIKQRIINAYVEFRLILKYVFNIDRFFK